MTTMTTTSPVLPDEDLVPEWDLADRLAKSLRVRNLGVQEMADSFGVTRNTIGNWLSGRRTPDKARLYFWATLTGVNLKWLETGQAPDNRPTPADLLPRLDSNQQPSGYRSKRLAGVNRTLTQNRRPVVGSTVALGRAA